ncbi:MAG: type III pantothenate kinase, partial [Planctomycetota bacterium]
MTLPPLLAVSLGNSRVQLGRFADGRLEDQQAVASDDDAGFAQSLSALWADAAPNPDDQPAVLLASVNPAREAAIEQALAKHTGRPVARIERDLPVPVGRQLDPEALPGEDRLLNAAAAYDALKVACAVVDLG